MSVDSPKIEVTAAARAALKAALESPDERVRLEISATFEHDLSVGPSAAADVEIPLGDFTLALDPGSAGRASGVTIDYVESAGGFKIENPNRPPEVRAMSVRELDAELKRRTPLRLIDVRTSQERRIAAIAGSDFLEDLDPSDLEGLDRDTTLVFYCHHGYRSRSAAGHFVQKGFRKVYNLSGGIDAWATEVDPKMPRY